MCAANNQQLSTSCFLQRTRASPCVLICRHTKMLPPSTSSCTGAKGLLLPSSMWAPGSGLKQALQLDSRRAAMQPTGLPNDTAAVGAGDNSIAAWLATLAVAPGPPGPHVPPVQPTCTSRKSYEQRPDLAQTCALARVLLAPTLPQEYKVAEDVGAALMVLPDNLPFYFSLGPGSFTSGPPSTFRTSPLPYSATSAVSTQFAPSPTSPYRLSQPGLTPASAVPPQPTAYPISPHQTSQPGQTPPLSLTSLAMHSDLRASYQPNLSPSSPTATLLDALVAALTAKGHCAGAACLWVLSEQRG